MWMCGKTCAGPACGSRARELRDAPPETVWATSIVSLRVLNTWKTQLNDPLVIILYLRCPTESTSGPRSALDLFCSISQLSVSPFGTMLCIQRDLQPEQLSGVLPSLIYKILKRRFFLDLVSNPSYCANCAGLVSTLHRSSGYKRFHPYGRWEVQLAQISWEAIEVSS
jgi:hypothetical protein